MFDFGITPVGIKDNIFGDQIAYVKHYDFSRANNSILSRIHAVTSVASICYANPNAVDKESLFNRLGSESKGLPSSSFEFIPMLIPIDEINYRLGLYREENRLEKNIPTDRFNIFKFGTRVEAEVNGKWTEYLLTNYRAALFDSEEGILDFTEYYNADANEFDIIKSNFHVFKLMIDLPTRAQLVRHRVNYQELSRRYVSGNKVPFNFFIDDKVKDIKVSINMAKDKMHHQPFEIGAEDLIDISLQFYNKLLDSGIKAEAARRFIPQGAYTEIWIGMNNRQLDNFLTLRLDMHAQREIRVLAENIRDVWTENINNKIKFREPIVA